MCGLCGTLGGPRHWTASVVPAGADGAPVPDRAARLEAVRLVNLVLAPFAIRVNDLHGSAFLVSGPTGDRAIVDALPQLWAEARRMAGRPIDPLDPALADAIAARGAG